MDGTSANNGKHISGVAHLRQSIRDILTTPIGSRVMRREYGARLFRLVDAPINSLTKLDIYAATAEALARWEPRFRLTKVAVVAASPGIVELDLIGEYLPDGQPITIDGIVVS